MDQLAELADSPLITRGSQSWSHFCYSPLITRGSAGRAQLVTLLLLSTPNPWISWQSTAGHTSITLHSSPVDQLAEHSWSHFCYSPLITRGSAGRAQLVTLLLLSTHHPWISWQSTAGLSTLLLLSTYHPWISWQSTAVHTSVTLQSSSVDQLAEHSWSHFYYSPLITRGSAGRTQLVTLLLLSTHHPCVSWQSTLVTLLLLSTHHPWISWQSTAGHTSVTLHSSPMDQLAEHSCSHFCYSPVIIRGSAGKAQLVTLLLLSTYHPWISWQNTAGHTSVTLHSSPVCQLAEHTGHTSVTLHSSPVDQLAEHSCSHCCYSPVIIRGSAGRAHWSHFCYSPLITRGSAGRAQLFTLLLLSSHHPWISWQSTAGHTSITLHLSPVDQLAEHSWSHFCYSLLITRVSAGRAHWSHFCYSPLITRGSAGRAQLVTLLLLSTHHPWISWQSTAVHTSVTLQSSSVDQLAKHSWSHFYYSPLITRGSAGRTQLVTLLLLSTHHPCVSWQSTLVTLLLLSTHHPWISWQSTAGHTSVTLHSSHVCQLVEHTGDTPVTLHSSPVDQLAEHSWSHFCYSPLITRGSAGTVQLVTLRLLSTHHPWISWQSTAGHTSIYLHSSPVDQLAEYC